MKQLSNIAPSKHYAGMLRAHIRDNIWLQIYGSGKEAEEALAEAVKKRGLTLP